MRIRKNILALSTTEKNNFFRALLMLKAEIVNPGAAVANQISTYDFYAAYHQAIFAVTTPGEAFNINGGHGGPAFGPWHRELLIRFELDLQRMVPGVMLPYWDWTDHVGTENEFFTDDYFGPDGGPGGVGGGIVESGYFAFDAPGTGTNPTPAPAWWPVGLAGWRISSLLAEGQGTSLRRFLGNTETPGPDPFIGLATQAQVAVLMQNNVYTGAGFRGDIEGQDPFHNFVHRWISGHMETGASPNDPIFFLHHCNIDRLWAMWQMDGHSGTGANAYPAANIYSTGHNLNDPMWPWVGATPGYSVSINALVNSLLPDYSTDPARSPADVLNHRDISVDVGGVISQVGYSYDTEVVVGVALDKSGSMSGNTPDPMTGAGSVTKWEAARLGVTHFLQDCEAAYSACEAYVVSGIQTFTTAAGTPVYDPVIAAVPPYGLVKVGSNYSAADFTAAAAPLTPGGGTPLAGALTETEDDMVRPPLSNLPTDDPRYMYVLTDGKRTAGPLMSSLGTPEFPNTTIFAMGFGVGSGWNGVDYTTIADLVTKGATAPIGVNQVFHGDNAGTINKFFTNSIAATIGYTPVVDPLYELFPGENSMTPFQVTSHDASFFISVLGFDYNDKNWAVMLKSPNGKSYMAETQAPVFITIKKRNGKFSIFLNRNGALDADWIGRWQVMVTYKPRAAFIGMVMFSPWHHLIPTGAPRVQGPIYTRVNESAKKSTLQRLSKPRPGNLRHPQVGISSPKTDYPGSVAVDIYAKTRLKIDLSVGPVIQFAGDKLTAQITIDTGGKGKVSQLNLIGRAISPGYSIGNLLAKTKLKLPVRDSKANINKEFNELAFLMQFEKENPDEITVIDREVKFARNRKDLGFSAKIEHTKFPGVYWISARIEGMITPENGRPERFSRIINSQVGLGIRIDEKSSKAALHWLAPNQFVVRFVAADKIGNLAAWSRMETPKLLYKHKEIKAEHSFTNDGWHELKVSLEGKKVALDKHGNLLKGANIANVSGEILKITKSIENSFKLKIGGSQISVFVPRFVADTKTKKVFPAGSAESFKIPVLRRQTFSTYEKALSLGFKDGRSK